MTKYIIILVTVVAFGGGTVLGTKIVPKCPDCKPTLNVPPCPAAVSLQNFDMDKMNNKKGNFTYSPQLHNVTVKIEAKDSLLVKQLLRSAK